MTVLHMDCVEGMKLFPDAYFDSIVTDPPYELGFMGKAWDASGIANNVEMWREALRVLKPGGHLLAFSGSRTYHRMVCAIEDAGFEIRDQIMWVYGSGFPKSLNLSGDWQGWGTALKPAHEPIVVARKPLAGTVAANVLQFGTGALNIDGCRVDGGARPLRVQSQDTSYAGATYGSGRAVAGFADGETTQGRWPANLIHDGSDEVLAAFPESTSGAMKAGTRRAAQDGPGSVVYGTYGGNTTAVDIAASAGSAARFFYCAKASKKDRDEGLESFEIKDTAAMQGNLVSGQRLAGDGTPIATPRRANIHPTVKPTELMRYLCRLVTPPGGTVLDPFAGSGSTGKACALERFQFIGFELDESYAAIAAARIEEARRHASPMGN